MTRLYVDVVPLDADTPVGTIVGSFRPVTVEDITDEMAGSALGELMLRDSGAAKYFDYDDLRAALAAALEAG